MPLPEDTFLANRYRIDALLAQNNSGAVYRAFDTVLNSPVAIKEKCFETAEEVTEFRRQALLLVGLHHKALPRVIHHFGVESRDRQYYLVMEFIEGETLWELIHRQKKPLATAPALHYIIQVCQAVDYLHRQNTPIIHRDIKPQNIKLTPEDRVFLVDFGLGSQPEPATGFVAPEAEISPATDLFALGATLSALLTGEKPDRSFHIQPERLAQAIQKATQPDPAYRPDSIAAWQKELETIHEESLASTPRPEEKPEPPPPSPEPQKQAQPAVAFWLVDSTGLGYPIGDSTLLIGSQPHVDILVDDPSVSARLRVEDGQCQIRAEGNVLLNGAGLSTKWQPMSVGDVIVMGQTRFHLTGSKPVKIAPPRQKSAPAAPAAPSSSASPAPARSRQRLILTLAVIGLAALALIGGILYFRQAASAPAADAVAVQAPTLTATPAPLPPTPTSTPPPSVEAKQARTTLVDVLPTATPAIRLSPSPSPTLIPLPTYTATSFSRPAPPVSAGPTVIPVQSNQTLDRIGNREVIDVDINLKNPQELYILLKGDGLYKSSRGGEPPWVRLPVDGSAMTAFVIDPVDPARFFAPTWNAVLRSEDGGNNWRVFGEGLKTANRSVNLVMIDPVNPDLLYGGIGSTLIVSTDGGESWSSQGYGAGLMGGKLHAILIDPFEHKTLYLGGQFGSIYKSTDGGHNFFQLGYNTGEGTFSLAAHPTRPNLLLAGINSYSAAIIKTENGQDFYPSSSGLVYGGADSAYSVIAFAPNNPSVIYTGTGYEGESFSKGMFKSVDGGENWFPINNDLGVEPGSGQYYYIKSIVVHPDDADIVWAATGGGLYHSRNGGASWQLQ